MKQFNCNWPAPVKVSRGEPPEKDMVNLSELPPDERRRAFARMKERNPELAGFVERMGIEFGRIELHVDKETADQVGVSRDAD